MKVKAFILMGLAATALGACANDQEVHHTKTAECSRLSGQYVLAPTPGSSGSGNFLTDNVRNKRADAARAHARKAGCL